MQMETKCNMNVPIEFAHAQLVDFAEFEVLLLGAGANVTRLDNVTQTGPGMKWLVEGNFRGKDRAIQLEMTDYKECESIEYFSTAKEIDAEISLNLIQLAKNETRLKFTIKPSPNTISARLILQSAKLARKTLQRRLDNRIENYAESVELKFLEAE